MHPALPQTMTPENLGVWIKDNSINGKTHTEEIPLTEQDIQILEHKSSVASRAIDDLETFKKFVEKQLKKGTPTNDAGEPQPVPITIPPTKGIEALEANRKFADDTIKAGFTFEHVSLFGIPYPEDFTILYFDASGTLYEKYTEKMTDEQRETYGKPLLKAIKDEPEGIDLFN